MTQNNQHRLQYLFQQYLNNQIKEEEYAEFWELLQPESDKETLSTELQTLWENASRYQPAIPSKAWEDKMQALLDESKTPAHNKTVRLKRNLRLRRGSAAAAVILLFLIGGGYFLFRKPAAQQEVAVVSQSSNGTHGLLPGGNKAVLTLSNGKSIVLNKVKNGKISQQGKTLIIKADSNRITYNPVTTSHLTDRVYNTLRTPRGGKYQITLPDGTKVWLNATSSLRFPTAFPGDKRIVEMTGEAYFEVAENAEKPFIVSVHGMQVKVLGTHFNIMAYDDAPVVKTTLLEGAVKVKNGNQSLQLHPGQQAQMNKMGELSLLKKADLNSVLAWKKGLFWFNDNTIEEVMRQVSRWYNADVEINGKIPQHFTGSISKNVNILRVFRVLKETGNIQFEIKDRKIIVTP